jgi:DNA polymerase/3'-5' exonuclease PolX
MDYKNTIISQLDIIRKDEIFNSQPFKAKAYQTVISQIKNIKHPILSFGDLKEVTGIGEKIRLKIEEIFQGRNLGSFQTSSLQNSYKGGVTGNYVPRVNLWIKVF